MIRIVADLGNSRLKWGRIGPDGGLDATVSLSPDAPASWSAAWEDWARPAERSSWAVASVNPPIADNLRAFLAGLAPVEARWFVSATDVPVPHALENARMAGADRALAVLAALASRPGGRPGPGQVVSCGSATVIERISAEGIWRGGAIAPGLGLSARALHVLTAQLPLVQVDEPPPEAWGSSTVPAMAAGLFWGAVGSIREILARQAEGLSPAPWVVWTGGEAPVLAPRVEGPGARIVPDLVLHGLARAAFPAIGPGGR